MAVKFVVSDPDVGAHEAIAQLHAAHAALETIYVVEQLQALDDHGSTAT